MAGHKGWIAVADHVKRRRLALGLRQQECVDRSGGLVSISVWSNIENAREHAGYRDLTLSGVCRALGWTTDSIDRILVGGEPEVVSLTPDQQARMAIVGQYGTTIEDLAAVIAQISAEVDELRAEVAEIRDQVNARSQFADDLAMKASAEMLEASTTAALVTEQARAKKRQRNH